MRRYFLGLLLVIGLLILLIVLIVHGGGKTKTTPGSSRPLVSFVNSNATVSMEIDGPVNANSTHNQVLITVGSSSATIQARQGYDGDVVKSSTYPNTQTSFSAFLHSLQYAGFTEGNSASSLSNELGYCPTGDRYIFMVQQNGNTLERYWTTQCSNSTPHSFEGNTSLVYTLFQAQIPDYSSVVQNLNL